MTRSLFVHLLPTLTTREQLQHQTAVVIDILRATTTILQALDAGVVAVTPVREIEEARRTSAGLPRPVLLGGERAGMRIQGFDLDNSPWNYTPDVCAGRQLVFTTTNGTRALDTCREAETIFVGAFSNLSALCVALGESSRDVHLVCAGTDGEVTLEDVLFAGAVAHRLVGTSGDFRIGNDSARLTLGLLPSKLDRASLLNLLRVSRGGQNLLDLGYDRDLEWAAEIDRIPLIATWDPVANIIVGQSPAPV